MKILKTLSALAISATMVFSVAALNVSAATTTQDGLEVSLTTDKEAYSKDEKITATLSVKNTNESVVTDIAMETIIPDGYEVADGTKNNKQLDKLAPNESAELKVVYVAKDSGEDNQDSEISQVSQESQNSEISTVSPNNDSPRTGDNAIIPVAVALVMFVSVLLVVFCFKSKKGRKLLSVILTVSIVGGASVVMSIQTSATNDMNQKQISITQSISVDKNQTKLTAKVSYSFDNSNAVLYSLKTVVDEGGSIEKVNGEYEAGSLIDLKAVPESGWYFYQWESSNGGSFSNISSDNTKFTMPNNDTVIKAIFARDMSEISEDELAVYFAYNDLSIIYADGDYYNSVINNIVLPTSYGDEEHLVNISWDSSNENVITSLGIVKRPVDNDVEVTLTANISRNDYSYRKSFGIRVIRLSDVSYSDIEDYNVIELEEINKAAEYPLEIDYNEGGTQAEFISGKFTTIKIDSFESALKSIYSVKTILGISDPQTELVWQATNHDGISLTYSFSQQYNNIPVYGRLVTVSADEKTGDSQSINSSFLTDNILSKVKTTADLSIDEIADKIGANDINNSYLTIYSLDDYQNSPVLAYVIRTDGRVIVANAQNGDIITSYLTQKSWGDSSTTGSGKNELEQTVTFPVQFHQWDFYFYYQEDVQRKIYIHGDTSSLITHEINTSWGDKTANSAYTNVITVYDWYKTHLGRNSIDNNGMTIDVNVHNFKNETDLWGNKQTDNAHWDGDNKEMCFFENESGGTPTVAACLDVIAHEMTHGVLQYIIEQSRTDRSKSFDEFFPYANYTGSINEGYADVFGYLVDDANWTMGENWETIRSLSNPEQYDAPTILEGVNYIPNRDITEMQPDGEAFIMSQNDITIDQLKNSYTKSKNAGKVNNYDEYLFDLYQSTLVHKNSSLVYHTVYLMNKYGVSKDKLEKIWYNSMSLGYDSTSNYHTVRKFLIQASKNNHLTDKEISAVRRAFDDEKIFSEKGNISIEFVDSDGKTMTEKVDVSVSMQRNKEDAPQPVLLIDTNTLGTTGKNDIYFGTYTTKISIPGYKSFKANVTVNEGKTTKLIVPVIPDGEGSISGTVTSATTGYAVDSVNMKVYDGWYKKEGTAISSTVSDLNGQYKFTLPAGYYTIEMSKEGYTTGYFNISIAGGKDLTNQNVSISPNMEFTKDFRVVLTWGQNPSDLDSHLIGKLADGSSYHVYYSNKNGYDSSHNKVANLDVDDTTSYGPETVTFTAETNGEYEYYIHWYAGTGTWATSNGKVEVYNNDQLVYVANVPLVNSKDGNWKIFTFNKGIFTGYNVIT